VKKAYVLNISIYAFEEFQKEQKNKRWQKAYLKKQ
jgi:hypothetical protein